jgi:hypothetical protein
MHLVASRWVDDRGELKNEVGFGAMLGRVPTWFWYYYWVILIWFCVKLGTWGGKERASCCLFCTYLQKEPESRL